MMEGLIYVAMVAVVIGVNQMLVWSAYHRGLADGYKKAADMLNDARKVAEL